MKKYILLALSVISLITLCACGNKQIAEQDYSTPNAVHEERPVIEETPAAKGCEYSIAWDRIQDQTPAIAYEFNTPQYLYTVMGKYATYFDAWALTYDDSYSDARIYLHTYFVPVEDDSELASSLYTEPADGTIPGENIIFTNLNDVELSEAGYISKNGYMVSAGEELRADMVGLALGYDSFGKKDGFETCVREGENQGWFHLKFDRLEYPDLFDTICKTESFELVINMTNMLGKILTLNVDQSNATIARS